MVVMADIVCPVVRADVTCYWKDMWRRLDAMRRLWQLCDVRLRTDDGSSFMAHSPVLAASSDVLHHMLVAARHETFVDGSGIVPVHGITPDVLRITLDFIYGVTPTSRADFERLRVGATRLGIEGAYEYCCRRLGENASRILHVQDTGLMPSDSVTAATEATALVELSSFTAVSDELVTRAEEVSTGDQNSANPTTDFDAAASSEMSESVDAVDSAVVPSDVPHAATMAHMSLEDLARSDECPHLRRLAGEILPAPILADDCLKDDSSGSLDDGCGFLDSVPLKKRIRNNKNGSDGSNVPESVSGLYQSGMAGSGIEDTALADTDNHAAQSLACDLSSNSHTTPVTSFGIEAQDQCPPTFLTNSISGGSRCSIADHVVTTSDNIAASMDFSNPLYATADFPIMPMAKTDVVTQSAQDCCFSYIEECYPITCQSSNYSWPADQLNQQSGVPVTTSNLLPPLSTCMPPFVADNFVSVLSTTNVARTDRTVTDSSTTDVVNRSADVLNGCPPNASFTDFGVLPNPWPNAANGNAVSVPHASENGISEINLLPADSGMEAYFGHSPVASTVPQFVPPVPTTNPSSSSSLSSSSVSAAGVITADLSYISLDDVSAVLKANGFSDKMSSPSEASPLNHTTDSHTNENHTAKNHTSDVKKAGTKTAANEGQSSVTRVCIFCQKPCKSER